MLSGFIYSRDIYESMLQMAVWCIVDRWRETCTAPVGGPQQVQGVGEDLTNAFPFR